MLHIVSSNRLDVLAARFVSVQRSQADFFATTPVLVASLGVGRWLQLRVADEAGIACNMQVSYPAQFIWKLVESWLPGVEAAAPVPGIKLRWLVYRWLTSNGASYPILAAAVADPLNTWHLARRVTALFGDYLVYRDTWLTAWGGSKLNKASAQPAPSLHEAWQRDCWAAIASNLGLQGELHPFKAFFTRLAAAKPSALANLPKRIALFGLPHVAPLYARFFQQLATHTEVDWYVLSPSLEYWGDLGNAATEHEAATAGNPLLASWARAERDMQFEITELLALPHVQQAQVAMPPLGLSLPKVPLLAQLQADMLAVQGATTGCTPDASIQLHGCHNLLRQVEVLHDVLLDAFARMPDLQASEVAVFTPQLQQVAPLIDAVFGAVPAGSASSLPYRVLGIAPTNTHRLADCVRGLLALPSSRFELGAMLGLLEVPDHARAFGFDDAELGTARALLIDAGARWGLNASAKAALGLPAEERHTWSWALARLLLGPLQAEADAGLCMGAGELEADNEPGLLPYPGVEGSDTQLIGKLVHWFAALEGYAASLAAPRSLAAWQQDLADMLDYSLEATDDSSAAWLAELQRLLAGLNSLARMQSAVDATVPIAVIRAWLDEQLQDMAPASLPTGAIAVAQLGELRGVPYRVIVLLGMDAGVFPRRDPQFEFDLMRAAPQRGDRSRSAGDTGALLHALLAAEDCACLIFNSHNARTNEVLQPVTPIAELLAVLSSMTALKAADLVRHHPLQPFSPAAFEGKPGAPASYQAQYLPVAQHLVASQNASNAALPEWLGLENALPYALQPRLAAEQLVAFLSDPTGSVFKRLGLSLQDWDGDEADEFEPTDIAALPSFQLFSRLVNTAIESPAEAGHLLQSARAGVELPHGLPGRLASHAAVAEAQRYVAQLAEHTAGLSHVALAWPVAGTVLEVQLPIAQGMIVGASQGRAKLKHLAWLGVMQHIASACGYSYRALWISRNALYELPAIDREAAAQQLEAWLHVFISGQQRVNLLPPSSAYAYLVASVVNGKSPTSKVNAAWQQESAEPLWQLAAPQGGQHAEQFSADWQQTANDWYGGWLAALQISEFAELAEKSDADEAAE